MPGPGPLRRSARAARPRLRLVHRGLRHSRSERGEGAAGRAGVSLRRPADILLTPLSTIESGLGFLSGWPSRVGSGVDVAPQPGGAPYLKSGHVAVGGFAITRPVPLLHRDRRPALPTSTAPQPALSP